MQVRRFFWVALAESVRLTSNSRTSTFKLHIRASDELQTRNLSPIAIFEEIATRNLRKMIEQRLELKKRDLLSSGHYKGSINVHLRDTSKRRLNDGNRPLARSPGDITALWRQRIDCDVRPVFVSSA